MAAPNPYVADGFPQLTLKLGQLEVTEVAGYSYTSDILTLTDTCTVDVINAEGRYSGQVPHGTKLELRMADPSVLGGAPILRMTGLVTNPRLSSKGGEKLQVLGADRGYYLEKCDAPLYANLSATRSFEALLDKLLKGPKGQDLGWGFQRADGSLSVASEIALYTHLNQGRAGIERSAVVQAQKGVSAKAFIPPLQVETGTKVGQLLIEYARRSHELVNVTGDGTLVIWSPNYKKDAEYRLEYHADARRSRNNCLDITIDDSCDGVVTDVTCVTTRIYQQKAATNEDPNADKIRGRYRDATALPFYMRMTFGDGDQIGKAAASARAQWAQQRGMYDAWTMQVDVVGHSQNGIFWTPDTMVAVDDSVHKVSGNYYCSACRYVRDRSGTRTTLTLKKPGLLAA